MFLRQHQAMTSLQSLLNNTFLCVVAGQAKPLNTLLNNKAKEYLSGEMMKQSD